jgi:hypothetical protein
MEKFLLEISINDLIERGFHEEEAKKIMNEYIEYLLDEFWTIQSSLLDKIENKFEKKSI